MSRPGPRLVALLAVVAGGCRPELPPPSHRPLPVPDGRPALLAGARAPKSDRIASYAIHARLDTATHRIAATETLRWKHDGVSPVASVPLTSTLMLVGVKEYPLSEGVTV